MTMYKHFYTRYHIIFPFIKFHSFIHQIKNPCKHTHIHFDIQHHVLSIFFSMYFIFCTKGALFLYFHYQIAVKVDQVKWIRPKSLLTFEWVWCVCVCVRMCVEMRKFICMMKEKEWVNGKFYEWNCSMGGTIMTN